MCCLVRRGGEPQRRQREIYDNGNSAAVLPYDASRNNVLLTRQIRMPIFLQDSIERSVETCAGKLDVKMLSIMKEMEEELGYRIAKAGAWTRFVL